MIFIFDALPPNPLPQAGRGDDAMVSQNPVSLCKIVTILMHARAD